MPRLTLRVLPAALLVVALSACGAAAAPEPVALDGDEVTIGVHDDYFDPLHAVVAVGTTVIWRWEGRRNHDVVGEDFASISQRAGEFRSTFDEPGEHAYRCRIHPRMTGVVEVAD